MSLDLLPIPEVPGLFVDAALTDKGSNLLFMSVWGRDTVCQEFLARLSLPVSEGGLDRFQVGDDSNARFIQTGNPERLGKKSCRADQTIFGSLAQLWLYDQLTERPDKANRRGYLLYPAGEDRQIVDNRLWQLIKETCHLPLLDHWREPFIELCRRQSFLTHLDGLGVNAWLVELGSSDLEPEVTTLIRAGRLTLEPGDQEAAAAWNEIAQVAELMEQAKAELDSDPDPLFGNVIYRYTREQAIADGMLIDVSEVAREAGFKCPVAVTDGVWNQCVAWSDEDTQRQYHQDESGRLWDVVWMAFMAIRQHRGPEQQLMYQLLCLPRDGESMEAVETSLKLMTGPGDHGEQVITILLPDED